MSFKDRKMKKIDKVIEDNPMMQKITDRLAEKIHEKVIEMLIEDRSGKIEELIRAKVNFIINQEFQRREIEPTL